MSQIFDDKGKVVPVTVLSASPIKAIYIKNEESDGYNAVVFGFEPKKLDKMNKPQRGAIKKHLGEEGEGFKYFKEWRTTTKPSLNVGDTVTVSVFDKGETVIARGLSKGKGFQGTVKRARFCRW